MQPKDPDHNKAAGFTLIEVTIALLIIMVALLGVFGAFTWAITYNAGNNSRATALAVLQQEPERLRSLKWTPTFTDADLTGGAKTPRIVTIPNGGGTFSITNTVDNAPAVNGIQNESYVCQSPQGAALPCTEKEISVTVRLERPSPGWQAAIPATIVMRRTRGN